MAFVFSEPRWNTSNFNETPGPGSHCPELIPSPEKKPEGQKKSIRKGKAFIRNVPDQQQTPKDSPAKEVIYNQPHKTLQLKNKIRKIARKLEQQNEEPATQKEISGQKFLQISSLQPGVIIDISNCTFGQQLNFQKSKEIFSLNSFQNFEIKKTTASIKPVCTEKFYIGSRDEHLRRKSSQEAPQKIKNRGKSGLHKHIIQKQDNQPLVALQKLQPQTYQKPKKQKQISAKHPFQKNELLYQKQQQPTGIEQQEEQQSQLSEFVADVVPGPGTYEINEFKQSTKKGMMFTQKNKARFSSGDGDDDAGFQFFYNPHVQGRRSKSRASQRKVGFGRSMTTKIIKPPPVQQQTQPILPIYSTTTGTIEHKTLKLKLADALNPGSFSSKVPRFPSPRPKISANTLRADLRKEEQLCKVKKQFNDHKISHPFSSGVTREHSLNHLTSSVDYSGQEYKTISNNLRQILSQPKYFFQTIEEKQPPTFSQPFQTPQSSSIQQQQANPKPQKTQIQIKHNLIQDIYGYRQRPNKSSNNRRQIKGYTFNINTNRYEPEIRDKENWPSPASYYREMDWVKGSFNMRFGRNQRNEEQGERDRQGEGLVGGIVGVGNEGVRLNFVRM